MTQADFDAAMNRTRQRMGERLMNDPDWTITEKILTFPSIITDLVVDDEDNLIVVTETGITKIPKDTLA